MRKDFRALLYLLLCIPAVNAGSGAAAQGPTSSYFESLLQIGREQGTHLGIVFDKERTLSQTPSHLPHDLTIAGIVKVIPGYLLRQEDGVMVVEPRTLPIVTAKMMSTVIGEFRSGPATVSQMSQALWMDLQVSVVSPPPQTFWGVLHTNDDQVTAGLALKNQNVRTILNRIVLTTAGTSWIVLPPPDSITGVNQDRLWNIVRYASASTDTSVKNLCCINWDLVQPLN